jgi:hypothetical protein
MTLKPTYRDALEITVIESSDGGELVTRTAVPRDLKAAKATSQTKDDMSAKAPMDDGFSQKQCETPGNETADFICSSVSSRIFNAKQQARDTRRLAVNRNVKSSVESQFLPSSLTEPNRAPRKRLERKSVDAKITPNLELMSKHFGENSWPSKVQVGCDWLAVSKEKRRERFVALKEAKKSVLYERCAERCSLAWGRRPRTRGTLHRSVDTDSQ